MVWSTPSSGALDPQAQALLEEFKRRPKVSDATDDADYVAGVRARYPRVAELSGHAEPIARICQTIAAAGGDEVPVRIYQPQVSRSVPLLVWFHGGGFIAGDLDTFDKPMRALANHAACTVISVAYRLAPEHPYPGAVEDAYTALCWVHANAEALGSVSRTIVAGGDSSGGNIATVGCMLARDRGGPKVALQILLYPDADARPGYHHSSWREFDGCVLDRHVKDRELAMYLPPAVDRNLPHVSPALSAPEYLREMPPALIVTAEFDPLRDEGEAYAAGLREAGVAASLARYPGMIHGFFQMAGKLDAGGEVIEQVAAAVRTTA